MKRFTALVPIALLLLASMAATLVLVAPSVVPVSATCPGSCTNNRIAAQSSYAFGASTFTFVFNNIINDPVEGNFGVTSVSCISGDTVSSITDADSPGWTQVASTSQGAGGAGNNNPVVTSVWTTTTNAGGDDTVTVTLSNSGYCSGTVAFYDTLANIFAQSAVYSPVYLCTGTSYLGNPCASNPVSYSNTFQGLDGSSFLVLNIAFSNSSNTGVFGGYLNTAPSGWAVTGAGMAASGGCVIPQFDDWGLFCQQNELAWHWLNSLSTSYTSGYTLDIGVPSQPNSGAICQKGTGGICYVEVGAFGVVFSNENQMVHYVTEVVGCNWYQLQCWWFPFFFMGLFSAYFMGVGAFARVSTKGLTYLLLTALSLGGIISVEMGILPFAFPVMLILLQVVYTIRFR